MKKNLFLLLIFPASLFAQDSCSLKNEKDRFNQDPRLTTGFVALGAGNDKFRLSVSADKNEIDFFIALDGGTTCFDDYSRAMITFDSKQRANLKNGGTTNCKGYFHFVFPNQANLNTSLTNMAQKKIATIQFTDTGNNKKIITLRQEDKNMIIKLTNCVLAQLEALRVDTWKPGQ
jgi:hypothetical protein